MPDSGTFTSLKVMERPLPIEATYFPPEHKLSVSVLTGTPNGIVLPSASASYFIKIGLGSCEDVENKTAVPPCFNKSIDTVSFDVKFSFHSN